jgi:nicotinamide-nucleotide amidase
MKCIIITIGDELLIGQTIDTNSAWIGQQLSALGIQVLKRIAVGDDANDIQSALNNASKEASLILITGGLGPTKDDITKATFCSYFGVGEVLHQPTLDRLIKIFEKRGKDILDINRKQASLPANCEVLQNDRGTAPGMWFFEKEIIYVSMPGVPHEMKHLMTEKVLPKLQSMVELPHIVHRNMMVIGLGESTIARNIASIEDALPAFVKLAYLPDMGVVKLRLSGYNIDLAQTAILEDFYNQIKTTLGDHVFATKETSLAEAVGELYKSKGKNFAVAESCTGGYVGHLVTTVPGSSAFFEGSMVTYSYAMKEKILGVNPATLATQGAVSEACVLEMLEGLLNATLADVGVAISGIAGPDGGTPDKPVGTVCFAVGTKTSQKAYTFQFFPGRMENIKISAYTALNLLRKELL